MPARRHIKMVLGLGDYERAEEILTILRQMYEVQVVEDSEEAYHVIHVFNPDIAILDYTLSKIHPIELYEGIALAHPSVHFIICVNEDNFKVAERVWKRRACDFIFKPFFPEQFVNDVNKLVRNLLSAEEIEDLKSRIANLEAENNRLKEDNKDA